MTPEAWCPDSEPYPNGSTRPASDRPSHGGRPAPADLDAELRRVLEELPDLRPAIALITMMAAPDKAAVAALEEPLVTALNGTDNAGLLCAVAWLAANFAHILAREVGVTGTDLLAELGQLAARIEAEQ